VLKCFGRSRRQRSSATGDDRFEKMRELERSDALLVGTLKKFAEPERRKFAPLLAETEKFRKLLSAIEKYPRFFSHGIGLGAAQVSKTKI
jgi:hypothetical protein